MQEYNGFTEKERLDGDKIIKKAIANGDILPLTQAKCCVCGQDKGIIQYHCEDYTPENILNDIAPLCWHCHQQLHRNKVNNPEKWKQYLKDVKKGVLKDPVYNKNYWTKDYDNENKRKVYCKVDWVQDILKEMDEL